MLLPVLNQYSRSIWIFLCSLVAAIFFLLLHLNSSHLFAIFTNLCIAKTTLSMLRKLPCLPLCYDLTYCDWRLYFSVLYPRHISEQAQDNTINLIHTLRNYLHYHIKCSKVLFKALLLIDTVDDYQFSLIKYVMPSSSMFVMQVFFGITCTIEISGLYTPVHASQDYRLPKSAKPSATRVAQGWEENI